ncbi:MAG: HIT family protein [Nanoarchaeota archaeon]|nr:HIT family protein [Nanoarchaeota archaeon]
MSKCIFCKIASGEIPSEKIFESDNFFVIKDVNPKVKGHSLVISKKHFENFMELSPELYSEFLETVKGAVEKLGAEAFNLVVNNGEIAGQIIPHLHLHILPRKSDDGFDFGV